jgi:hypothetical protein
VGKSTAAVLLATELASHGGSVTMIDPGAFTIAAGLDDKFSGLLHLEVYDIGNTNVPGMGNIYLGIACTPGDTLTGGPNPCSAPMNSQYRAINRRGGTAYSSYNAMNVRYDIQDIKHSGLTLRMNYTWSHAMDELSDTFSSSFNQFNLGYTDVFHPSVDYGNAEFDNRHCVAISAIWQVPFTRGPQGAVKKILDGWEFAPIFTARMGNYAIDGSYLNPITGDADFGPWPSNFTGRDYFHTPGNWNLNLGMYKNTRISERATLQLRLEAYNAFNHANFGVNIGGAYIYGCSPGSCASGSITGGYGLLSTGAYGDNRNIQLGAKVIF